MGFLGMLGSGDWATDQRPKAWREMIQFLYPNGAVTLTGLTSKMGSEKVSDPEFNWWTESLEREGGAVSNMYAESTLTTAYVYATHQATIGIAGGQVYAKVALAVAKQFVVGDVVMLRDTDRPNVDVRGEVFAIDYNADNSTISVRLQVPD